MGLRGPLCADACSVAVDETIELAKHEAERPPECIVRVGLDLLPHPCVLFLQPASRCCLPCCGSRRFVPIDRGVVLETEAGFEVVQRVVYLLVDAMRCKPSLGIPSSVHLLGVAERAARVHMQLPKVADGLIRVDVRRVDDRPILLINWHIHTVLNCQCEVGRLVTFGMPTRFTAGPGC